MLSHSVTDVAIDVLVVFDWLVLGYFLILNTTYLFLIAVAAVEFAHVIRREPFSGHDQAFASPLSPPVSVLVPAHDEQAGIVESVRAMLALHYPVFEVVVIDDGSSDGTFDVLEHTFGLVPVAWVPARDVPVQGAIRSVHVPASGAPLTVVRKESAGSKTDALNAGVNAARYPLLCMVDADALLDPDALLRVARPFVDYPAETVATGGVVRAANGCVIERGRVVSVRMPRRWLERIQVMEYMRAFLLGRAGFSRLGALVVISGAFGLFRRDIVVEVGGLDPNTVGEDAELVVRIHRRMRELNRVYRVVFLAEPVCWTEVPSSRAFLSKQRRRWSRGLTEILVKHRAMVGNPRYGRIGLVALPYYLLFEVLSPFIELFGLAAVIVGLAVGAVDFTFAVLFGLVAVGYGIFLSVSALTIEEYSFHRYPSWRDLGIGFVAAILENIGYRQLHSWWRLRGVVAALRNRPSEWGAMKREGFGSAAAGSATATATATAADVRATVRRRAKDLDAHRDERGDAHRDEYRDEHRDEPEAGRVG